MAAKPIRDEEALLNHLALPPQLPQRQDAHLERLEVALLTRLVSAAKLLRDLPGSEDATTWDAVRRSLSICQSIARRGRLERSSLLMELKQLGQHEFLLLYIRSQNAAILIQHSTEKTGTVTVEVYEASPRCQNVLEATGALQWDFPGAAVAIPLADFENEEFLHSFSSFLEQASLESTERFAAHSVKAGMQTVETRDTPDPALISCMLMALLEAHGTKICPPLLRKRVRDDVCWEDAAMPWRRLPYWLVARVAIQRYLSLRKDADRARMEYKFFVAVVLKELLQDLTATTTVERLSHLRAKLARRLTKLEADKAAGSLEAILCHDHYSTHLGSTFLKAINHAQQHILQGWSKFKEETTKKILPLPRRANEREMLLTLQCSKIYLNQAIERFNNDRMRPRLMTNNRKVVKVDPKDQSFRFANQYLKLAEMETKSQATCQLLKDSPEKFNKESFMDLAARIQRYLNLAIKLYEDNAEQKSIMILTVMEMWMRLDQWACLRYPLLEEFHPAFTSELLDVVLLLRFNDMLRLEAIQKYIKKRIAFCGSRLTIFDDPIEGCFAQRYFDESDDSGRLKSIFKAIEDEAELKREQKKAEWAEKTQAYEDLAQAVNQGTCMYRVDENNPLGRGIHDHRCQRCRCQSKMARMKIRIFEHPLPTDPVLAKVAVFELGGFRALETYRDTTWFILSRLAFPNDDPATLPKCMLRAYSELQHFVTPSPCSVVLGSTTKSFLYTHYANISFPTEWNSVCRPNGLRYAYFDQKSETWTGRRRFKPSFANHCKLQVPSSSALADRINAMALSGEGPSSYEIVASQASCPTGVNVHEYQALQYLLSGKSQRWPCILRELGASNINFSTEASHAIVNHLVLQCGPVDPGGDSMRMIHSIFNDSTFCTKLMEQLKQRMDSLAANWREVHLMDELITLALRMYTFTSPNAQSFGTTIPEQAICILELARVVTLQWMNLLRGQLREARDASTAKAFQTYVIWAALLCKRTFLVYLDVPVELDADRLKILIECSITLQNNLVSDPSILRPVLRNAVVRDYKLVHQLQPLIHRAMHNHKDAFISALEVVWPTPEGHPRTADAEFDHDESSSWFRFHTKSSEGLYHSQSVEYNSLLGLLLVDGMPVGQLPPEQQRDPILSELFGNQNLLTYPSNFPGMQYTLCIRPNGFQVHVGVRNDKTFIRACKGIQIVELVPRGEFGSPSFFDLPGPLVTACFHWLDLRTRKLEITQSPNIWASRRSNWVLDTYSGRCSRGDNEVLIDPHSPLFHRVARIFEGFELRQHIKVHQSYSIDRSPKPIGVELPRLQLWFYVNINKRLQCPRLQAEIDANQDAGTWYGLHSKLVVRGIENDQRTILVPLGELGIKRHHQHVIVNLRSDGLYGSFHINKSLGRVDCAPEPKLIYTKALLHAYTSFVVPDPLTRRTGTEEALHWLTSGICQPWMPLQPLSIWVLESLATLTPVREYYPKDLRVMKREHWNKLLTTTIQHEAFRSVINRIIARSANILLFNPQTEPMRELPSAGNLHLNIRAWVRLHSTQRPMEYAQPPIVHGRQDCQYLSRDRSSVSNPKYASVLEIAQLIRMSPEKIRTELNLSGLLSGRSIILGFGKVCEKILLSDRLNLDIRREWGPLVRFMQSHSDNKSALMFFLAPIAFRLDAEMSLIRTLVAFAVFEDLKVMILPQWPEYEHFQPDMIPNAGFFTQLLISFCTPPPEDDRGAIEELASAKLRRQLYNDKRAHEQLAENQCKALAKNLVEQWPCLVPTTPALAGPLLVDLERAMKEAVHPEWARLFRNHELSVHLAKTQAILKYKYSEHHWKPSVFVPLESNLSERIRGGEMLSLSCLMKKGGPRISKADVHDFSGFTTVNGSRHKPASGNGFTRGIAGLGPANSFAWTTSAAKNAKLEATGRLETIVSEFSNSESSVRQKYGATLMQSIETFKLKQDDEPESSQFRILPVGKLTEDVLSHFNQIKASLETPDIHCSTAHIQWLQAGMLWPPVTPITLLEQLRSTSECQFGSNMRESVIRLGLAITKLQRQTRLNELAKKQDTARYIEEQSNAGHTNWKPADYPDWLLMEIEANLLIRPDQVDVALETIRPSSGQNSLLQMNMGQGKTSCIIPMAAALLADGKHLARVVVPRALLQQTAYMLNSRIGGLLNREVRHIPFSRRTCADRGTIRTYYDLHKELQKSRGVVLCLAEHNLSFMLSGQQQLLDARVQEAEPMVKVQAWLGQVCRDILDESDYTLAVKTQLIYPSGALMTVNGHPHRWQVVEAILKLVDIHLYQLARTYPRSIEVIRRPNGGYPLMFFLRPDVEDELLQLLTNDICNGRGGVLPIAGLNKADRTAIKSFITSATVTPATVDHIRVLAKEKIRIGHIIYLLRGLLVNRILMMTLKKRWNVQYGLHKSRDPMAVPFHAKMVPSDHSEWGHPDVAILFTCLAFYYDGLSLAQLRESLEHCLKSDDPSSEYDRWTQSSTGFPESLKEWNSVNIEDDGQLHDIWRSVRYSVVVIDYFLNNFVFPRHARQFKVKLQSNGWDIPHFAVVHKGAHSNGVKALTTGFSGTNDNRTMLPLNIQQQDLPRLSHINAEVLTYLLQPRNQQYDVMQSHNGKRLREEGFLAMLTHKKIPVLIDAGAQILEMDNLTLAKTWLEIDFKRPGALYFDKENKPWILSQGGLRTPLVASVYADDLRDCLVYLDEAHTRGTDLKLPKDAKGALTLGLGQTKDHTVQAAMRLRQLGTTQSVHFFAPPEVHQSILDSQGKTKFDTVDSSDVIKWLLTNTCDGIEQLQPLYYSQGIDFCRRMQAAIDSPNFLTNSDDRERYVAAIKQEEQQTLQKLYEPKFKSKPATVNVTDPCISQFVKELNTRRKAFQDTGNAVHASALQEVEQERQVIHEVESVRQVKKPYRFPAWTFPGLHRDLETFARTGRSAAQSDAYRRAFDVLARTSLGRKFKVVPEVGKSSLYVTAEFEKTVKFASETGSNNHFMRPVNWILWSPLTETAIIVTPEEAEKLIPIVREARPPATYILTYATPVTRKMLHFNQLKYYTIPAAPVDWIPPEQLVVELGIFAGRLYFEWHEYELLCQFLGVNETGLKMEDLDLDDFNDGVDEEDETIIGTIQAASRPFARNALAFMQEWLAMRRRGQDFVHTPMGFVTQSKPLQEDHPFFRRVEVSQTAPLPTATAAKLPEDGDEDVVEEVGDANMMHAGAVDDVVGDEEDEIEYGDEEMYHDAQEHQ